MKLESVKVEEKCKPSFEKHCKLWGYKTEVDEDGFYVDSLTQRVFNAYYDAWQASRAAVVVKLPDVFDGSPDNATYYDYMYRKTEMEKALDDVGVDYE